MTSDGTVFQDFRPLAALLGETAWGEALSRGFDPRDLLFWAPARTIELRGEGLRTMKSPDGVLAKAAKKAGEIVRPLVGPASPEGGEAGSGVPSGAGGGLLSKARSWIAPSPGDSAPHWPALLAARSDGEVWILPVSPGDPLFRIPPGWYASGIRSEGPLLEIHLFPRDPSSELLRAVVGFDLERPELSPCGGAPHVLLEGVYDAALGSQGGRALPRPLLLRVGSAPPEAVLTALRPEEIVCFHDRGTRLLPLKRVPAWAGREESVELYLDDAGGLVRIQLASGTRAGSPLDEPGEGETPPPAPPAYPPEGGAVPELAAFLGERLPEVRAERSCAAFDLAAAPHYPEPGEFSRLLLVERDGTLRSFRGSGRWPELTEEPECWGIDLGGERYVQLQGGRALRIAPAPLDEALWTALTNRPGREALLDDPGVLSLWREERGEFLGLLRIRDDRAIFLRGEEEVQAVPIEALREASFDFVSLPPSMRLAAPMQGTFLAPRFALLALCKAVKVQTTAVELAAAPLKDIYRRFIEVRRRTFLVGLFGRIWLVDYRLQGEGGLPALLREILRSPSGPLPEALERRLLSRLTVLELARQQIARGLERWSVFYPHYWAEQERLALREVFGGEQQEELLEKEAWRIFQGVRVQMRQTQGALASPLNEIGRNLGAISFAFPEEIRCASLSAFRRASVLSESVGSFTLGASLIAQMAPALRGAGRLFTGGSDGEFGLGDVVDIAMTGALGLALVGRLIQRHIQKKEERIRIRAYGYQALEWWLTFMDSLAVAAYECDHFFAELGRASMDRDKRLLEQAKKENLPELQRRLARTLKERILGEFDFHYSELIPGANLLGSDLVRDLTRMADGTARGLIGEFSRTAANIAGGL